MPSTTRLVGILLILLGLASYMLTGRTSITALIPAFFGIVFVVLAFLGRQEHLRKHVMHAAVAVGLLGLLATLGRLVPALAAGGDPMRPAALSQAVMALLLAVYVALGVKSFIDARRARRL
ncbi:MAG: hypothetical protein AB7H88_14810 [Vicinamibacterales bacterium]